MLLQYAERCPENKYRRSWGFWFRLLALERGEEGSWKGEVWHLSWSRARATEHMRCRVFPSRPSRRGGNGMVKQTGTTRGSGTGHIYKEESRYAMERVHFFPLPKYSYQKATRVKGLKVKVHIESGGSPGRHLVVIPRGSSGLLTGERST